MEIADFPGMDSRDPKIGREIFPILIESPTVKLNCNKVVASTRAPWSVL